MERENSSLCLMPWIHLYVDTNGFAKACCNSSITYGNIRKNTIDEIWNGDSIKEFRKNNLAGIKDKRCSACFKREAADKESVRTETLKKFSHIDWPEFTDKEGNSPKAQPIYFDIRFSNLCNFKCRTCWHGASSSWFEEAKKLKNNLGNKAIIKATSDNHFIDQLINSSAQIEEVYFAGGEPLMMEEHYFLLDKLISTEQTNVHLRYNTNLSQLHLKHNNAIHFWNKFSTITLSISIDNLGRKAEYIRKGLIWEQLLKNMLEIKSKCPHIKLEIAPTISILSIIDLPQLHRFFIDENLLQVNDIYLNVLDRPDYYNIKALPEKGKNLAINRIKNHIEWLETNNASKKIIEEFEAVILYMNQDNWNSQLHTFLSNTALLDQWRKENFKTIFPELSSFLIESHIR